MKNGFSDFSSNGICFIHKELFGDVYEWAGQYRKINIKKRENILAGQSVWYSDCTNIEQDLERAWKEINNVEWTKLGKEDFAKKVARLFPDIWQVHPFREGNTRTVVMLITFFAEHYGYYFDQELMSASAGYVRNAFVLASMGEYSEYEHLEKIFAMRFQISRLNIPTVQMQRQTKQKNMQSTIPVTTSRQNTNTQNEKKQKDLKSFCFKLLNTCQKVKRLKCNLITSNKTKSPPCHS